MNILKNEILYGKARENRSERYHNKKPVIITGLLLIKNYRVSLKLLQFTKEKVPFNFCILVAITSMNRIFADRGGV